MSTGTKKPAFYYGWVIVFICFMVYAVVFVSAVSVNTLFVTPVCEDFQIERATMTFYMTVSSIATLISAPMIGRLMGKYSPRCVGMVFVVVFGCALIGLSLTQNIYQFYAVAFVRGIGFAGSTLLLVNVLTNNWFGPKKKGIAVGIATMGSSVGGFFILPIITNIIDTYSWRWGYRVLALLMMVVMLILLAFFAVDTPEQKGLKRLGELDLGDRPPVYGPSAKEAKKLPAFWIMILGYSIIVITTSALSNHAVPYFTDLGIDRALAARIQSIGLLTMVAGKYMTGWINDKFGARKAITITFIFLAMCYVFMYSLSLNTKLLPVYLVFYGLSQALPLLAPSIMISSTFGNRGFAALVAWGSTGNGIGNCFGPFLFGKVFDVTGSYAGGWLFLALLSIIGGVLILIGMRTSYRDYQSKEA